MSREARLEKFINDSKETFGDRFDHGVTRETFVNQKSPVDFYCNIHDARFTVKTPANHFKNKGGGCPKCKSENLSNARVEAAAERKAKQSKPVLKKQRNTEDVKAENRAAKETEKKEIMAYALPIKHLKGVCADCGSPHDYEKTCITVNTYISFVNICQGKNCKDELRYIVARQYTGVCRAIAKTSGEKCGDYTSGGNEFCLNHREKQPKNAVAKIVVKSDVVCCAGHVEWKAGTWHVTPCKSQPQDGDLYCGKHKNDGKRYQDSLKGIRYCNGYIRGCRSEMPEGSGKNCDKCLETNCAKELKNNETKREAHQQQFQDLTLANVACGNCGTLCPREEYVTKLGKHTMKCAKCINNQRDVEANRAERDRTLQSQIYCALETTKQLKKKWRLENPLKVQGYGIK